MKNRRSPSGLSRAEASAQARRGRAMAHLERVRNARRRPALPVRKLALVVVAVSSLAGLIVGIAGFGARPLAGMWISGARWMPAEEIAEAAELRRGVEPDAVDAAAIAERLASLAWVERARVLALPNGSLLIGVSERQPAALLAGDPAWAVDRDGVPFAPAPDADLDGLLRLETSSRPQPGEPDADLARALAVARSLPEKGLPAAQELRIAAPSDPEGLSLRLPGLKARVVLGRENLDARLADLARLLDAEIPELERATRIDLRFEDQAVLDVEPPSQGAAQAAAKRGVATPSNSRRAG